MANENNKIKINTEGLHGQTEALDASSTAGNSQTYNAVSLEVQAQPTARLSADNISSASVTQTEDDNKAMDLTDDHSMPQLDKLTIREPRLKTCERKRFRWLVAHGHSREEALDLCKKTIAEREGRPPTSAEKRVRSEDSTPGKQAARKKRKVLEPSTTKQAPQKPSYSGVIGTVKVGLVPANYPTETLTVEQQTTLEERLARLVLLCKNKPGPKFRGVTFRPGYVVVNCDNQLTADWVKNQEGELNIQEMKMKVLDENQIPSPHIITGFFPNSRGYSMDDIRSFIRIQNDLPAHQWKPLKTIDTGKNCVEVVFSVDHASYEALRATDFVISYRLGTIKLHPKKDKLGKKPVDSTDARVPTSSSSAENKTSAAPGTSKNEAAQALAEPQETSPDKPAQSTGSKKPHSDQRNQSLISRRGREHTAGGPKYSTRKPFVRQERMSLPSSRNKGKPWKHQRESRNERH